MVLETQGYFTYRFFLTKINLWRLCNGFTEFKSLGVSCSAGVKHWRHQLNKTNCFTLMIGFSSGQNSVELQKHDVFASTNSAGLTGGSWSPSLPSSVSFYGAINCFSADLCNNIHINISGEKICTHIPELFNTKLMHTYLFGIFEYPTYSTLLYFGLFLVFNEHGITFLKSLFQCDQVTNSIF